LPTEEKLKMWPIRRLKNCLNEAGLHQSGLKVDLVKRLLEHYQQNPTKIPGTEVSTVFPTVKQSDVLNVSSESSSSVTMVDLTISSPREGNSSSDTTGFSSSTTDSSSDTDTSSSVQLTGTGVDSHLTFQPVVTKAILGPEVMLNRSYCTCSTGGERPRGFLKKDKAVKMPVFRSRVRTHITKYSEPPGKIKLKVSKKSKSIPRLEISKKWLKVRKFTIPVSCWIGCWYPQELVTESKADQETVLKLDQEAAPELGQNLSLTSKHKAASRDTEVVSEVSAVDDRRKDQKNRNRGRPANRNKDSKPQRDMSKVTCWECKKVGHFSRDCRAKPRAKSPTNRGGRRSRGGRQGRGRGRGKPQHLKVVAEEGQGGEVMENPEEQWSSFWSTDDESEY
jgi:hypothetical protein